MFRASWKPAVVAVDAVPCAYFVSMYLSVGGEREEDWQYNIAWPLWKPILGTSSCWLRGALGCCTLTPRHIGTAFSLSSYRP